MSNVESNLKRKSKVAGESQILVPNRLEQNFKAKYLNEKWVTDITYLPYGETMSMYASDRFLVEGTTLNDIRQTEGTIGYSPNLHHGVIGKGLNDYDRIFSILSEVGYEGMRQGDLPTD